MLNLAIGDTSGGDPPKTEFPAKFEVDWVRVYQAVRAPTTNPTPAPTTTLTPKQ